ncbi:MAG: 3-deoxy-D-manno-octulosonic acid transferase, partial [Candidatus Omnitrophica bacterium]|nr:3-deoxy-D-manno-octulosonic acid transferase [Candidatus Omnitrophota bacterium]
MIFLFDLIFALYVLVYFPILVLRGKWHEGFKERLGFFSDDVKKTLAARRNIWIHAVSVGEVVAIDGIIKRLKAMYPDKQLVLSVTTKTGYSLAKRK